MNLNRLKKYYATNPWKSRIFIALFSLTLIVTFIRIILTPAIIYSSTSWLEKQGIQSSIEDIELNIIDGTVSLINATGNKDGEPLFQIGRIDIHWRWSPLSEKTIVITNVLLHHFQLNIEQYSDEIIIGGVTIPLTDATGENNIDAVLEQDEKTTPWAASLGKVVFTELNICYLQHTSTHETVTDENKFIDYCVNLDEMTWGGTISYATDKDLLKSGDLPISSTGNFSLKGLTITDNKLNNILLSSESNTLQQVVVSGLNNIHINTISMNDLSALKRDDDQHNDTLRFNQLAIDNIKLTNLNSVAIDKIIVDGPGLYLVKLKESTWEHQQWLPVEEDGQPSADKAKETSSPFSFSLNTLVIKTPDLCHLNTITDFYYCFTADEINWTGNIDYKTNPAVTEKDIITVKGDFTLSQPNIKNATLERNLLSFDELNINGLNVSSLDDVKLKSLSVTKLNALQRGKKQTDNTLEFNSLKIKDISYTGDSIAIDTVKLTELSNTVSKNKNGTWEHDKWIPKEIRESLAKDKTTKKSDKAIKISLNELSIESKKEILFIDNSTKPAMEIGLHSLSFYIKNLYSSKPKSDSAFKFYAKTKRHSTIDVKGTVRPFDDKVSFTANGDLKGFDLRAATPATQKSIGHIIKTGQLDAKLKLLAIDGELDSNVALSLYHFHIEPTSKEAAAELDAEFGMPLNQTLVLLRDKDDSIHLDIPITGDINNPDFDPMHAIIKATSTAATVTLITFYTPYGLIYAGGNVLFDLATALDFDPLDFKPGESKLNAENKEQLANLTKLLIEKPQVHLTLCGTTNQSDLFKLYPDIKEEMAGNKKDNDTTNDEVVLTKEYKSRLKKLAVERQVNSKNYLISEARIGHDRLILCEPAALAEEEAKSGVEINI